MIWIVYGVRLCMLKSSSDERNRLYAEHMAVFLLITFLGYPRYAQAGSNYDPVTQTTKYAIQTLAPCSK